MTVIRSYRSAYGLNPLQLEEVVAFYCRIFREDWGEEHNPEYVLNRIYREVQGSHAFLATATEPGGQITGLTWGYELPVSHIAVALKIQRVNFEAVQALPDDELRKVEEVLKSAGFRNALLWSEILIERSKRGTNLLNDLVRVGAKSGSWNVPVVIWTDMKKSTMYPIAMRYWRAKDIVTVGDVAVLLIHPTWPMKLAYSTGTERELFSLMRKNRRQRK